MSAFAPKNADHAISAVAFTITFASPLSAESIERAKGVEASVRDFLPGVTAFPDFPPPVRAALRGAPTGLPNGVIFQRVRPDGSPEWTLTAQQNIISAQCMAYTRWAEVWGRVRGWLQNLYREVESPDLKVTSVSLQYIDQFLADEPLDDDAIQKCFQIKTPYLPARTFENRDLWHVHQGWFEAVTAPLPGKRLQVLNIGTQRVLAQIRLNIDHLMRHDVEGENPRLFAEGGGYGTVLDGVMGALHENNKMLLRSLLTTDMAQLIHLDD